MEHSASNFREGLHFFICLLSCVIGFWRWLIAHLINSGKKKKDYWLLGIDSSKVHDEDGGHVYN